MEVLAKWKIVAELIKSRQWETDWCARIVLSQAVFQAGDATAEQFKVLACPRIIGHAAPLTDDQIRELVAVAQGVLADLAAVGGPVMAPPEFAAADTTGAIDPDLKAKLVEIALQVLITFLNRWLNQPSK